MATMLTKDQVKELYEDLIVNHTSVFEYDLYQKNKVLEYAADIERREFDFATEMINLNESYDYPPEYLPDRLFDYWVDHHNSGRYNEAISIIRLIDKALAFDETFKKTCLIRPAKNDGVGEGRDTSKKHSLSVPHGGTSDQILDFWLKLSEEAKDGSPYWKDKNEIIHFVNYTFKGFPGVDEVKQFYTEMGITDLAFITFIFKRSFGVHGEKSQYRKMIQMSFPKANSSRFSLNNIKFYASKKRLMNLYQFNNKD